MQKEERMIRIGMLLLAAAALVAGCSSANSPGGGNGGTSAYHVDASGRSIPEWVISPAGGSHASTAAFDYADTGGVASCAECHGADLSGGISKVSCFGNTAGCHHGPVTGWAAPQTHGAAAKQEPGSSGFRTCQICHGPGYSGGGSGVSCFGCHTVNAPHAQGPWRGTGVTHVDTDGGNAPVCAQCHFAGSPINPGGHPIEPAAAGSEPGCYNNTLCHGFYVQNRSAGGIAPER
jgi:hypothetical protein